MFDRLLINLVPEGEKTAKQVRYFDYIMPHLKKIDPDVQVIPSGGVVRSAISHIYDEMLNGKTFDDIIDATEDAAIEVRGVGSDFDVFARSPNGNLGAIKQKMLEITNSAETQYDMTQSKNQAKRALFTIGDVKDFDQHWERSVAQGGSVIDFLGFDYEKGIFLEPPKHQSIVKDMIRGVYEYIAPTGKIEDAPKQTVRGFRALLELPWLQVKNEKQIRSELEAMIKALNEGGVTPSGKTIEQFAKMVRNTRYFGAHNRFYRGPKGSIEEMFIGYARDLSKKVGKVLFPEYIGNFNLGGRRRTDFQRAVCWLRRLRFKKYN